MLRTGVAFEVTRAAAASSRRIRVSHPHLSVFLERQSGRSGGCYPAETGWVGHSCPTLLTLLSVWNLGLDTGSGLGASEAFSCYPKPEVKSVGRECPTQTLPSSPVLRFHQSKGVALAGPGAPDRANKPENILPAAVAPRWCHPRRKSFAETAPIPGLTRRLAGTNLFPRFARLRPR